MEKLYSIYENQDLYTLKKAEYTSYFALFIVIYAILSAIIGLISPFQTEPILLYLGIFMIFVSLIFYFIHKGYLESAINMLCIAGIIKTLSLFHLQVGLHFYVIVLLIMFVTSIVKLKEYQIVSVYLILYFISVIKAFLPDESGLYLDPIRLVSYKISIVIGLLMFLVVLYYLSRIVDREIRKTEKYNTISRTDTLTGVFNRFAFNEAISKKGGNQSYGLLILDLDHFKTINDRFGHLAGDEVLRVFSNIVKEDIKTYGELYRIGGEEFAIIIENVNRQSLGEICKSLIHLVSHHDFGLGIQVTTSIGAVHVSKEKCPAFDDCYRISDDALYQAKSSGRNKYVLA